MLGRTKTEPEQKARLNYLLLTVLKWQGDSKSSA